MSECVSTKATRSRLPTTASAAATTKRPPPSPVTTAPPPPLADATTPSKARTAIQRAVAHVPTAASVWTIWYAAQYGKAARVASLLDRRAVASIDVQEYRTRWSALHFAARCGQLAVVQVLLERGADPDLPDLTGNSPLHLSVGWGNLRCSVVLLENGAQASLRNHRQQTPLEVAAALARHDQVKLLSSWQPPLGLTPEELLQRRASRASQPAVDPLEARVAVLETLQRELQDEADPLVRQELHAMCAKTQQHGERHASLLTSLERLCGAFRSCGRLEKALRAADNATQLAESLYGEDDLLSLAWLNNASELLLALGRGEESRQYAEQAFRGFEASCGPTDLQTLAVLENLCAVCVHQRTNSDDGAAESHLRELLQRLLAVYDSGWNDRVFRVVMQLGVLVLEQKRVSEAQRLFEDCLAHAARLYGEKDANTIACIEQLGRCAFLLGDFEHAERLFLRSVKLSLSSGVSRSAAHHRRLHNNLAMLAIARRSAKAVHAKLQAEPYRCDTGSDSSVPLLSEPCRTG